MQSHEKALFKTISIIEKEDPTPIKVIFETSARGSSKQDTQHTNGQQRHDKQAHYPDNDRSQPANPTAHRAARQQPVTSNPPPPNHHGATGQIRENQITSYPESQRTKPPNPIADRREHQATGAEGHTCIILLKRRNIFLYSSHQVIFTDKSHSEFKSARTKRYKNNYIKMTNPRQETFNLVQTNRCLVLYNL